MISSSVRRRLQLTRLCCHLTILVTNTSSHATDPTDYILTPTKSSRLPQTRDKNWHQLTIRPDYAQGCKITKQCVRHTWRFCWVSDGQNTVEHCAQQVKRCGKNIYEGHAMLKSNGIRASFWSRNDTCVKTLGFKELSRATMFLHGCL